MQVQTEQWLPHATVMLISTAPILCSVSRVSLSTRGAVFIRPRFLPGSGCRNIQAKAIVIFYKVKSTRLLPPWLACLVFKDHRIRWRYLDGWHSLCEVGPGD